MKHNKNADTLLFLLLFTKSQREKKIKEKRGEKRQILGIIYHNIYLIPKINFKQNSYLYKVYLPYFQLIKKLKRFHLRFA